MTFRAATFSDLSFLIIQSLFDSFLKQKMAKKKEKRTFNVSTFMFVKEFWSVGWTKRDAWNIFRSCDGFLHHFMTFNRQTIN